MTHKILKQPAVIEKTGIPRASLNKMIAKGKFPAPIKLNDSRATGWVEAEIDAWVEKKMAERDAAIDGGAS